MYVLTFAVFSLKFLSVEFVMYVDHNFTCTSTQHAVVEVGLSFNQIALRVLQTSSLESDLKKVQESYTVGVICAGACKDYDTKAFPEFSL